MNSPPPKATVVIRCFNEADHLPKLLTELRRQSYESFEIVAVDSGSDDGTLDILGKEDVRIEHIRRDEFSFGRSLNIGCGVARGEFLVFISAHCYPERTDWLEQILSGFADEKVGAVYGMQRGVPESHFSERQVFRRWYPDTSVARQDTPFLNNANCAVRRSLWEQFPYDESLTGLEDVAWAQTVMRDGWWVTYNANAGVIHVHNETTGQIRNRYQREAITFQKQFPSEHFNLWDFLRLSSSNVTRDWRAAANEGVLWQNLWPIVRFRVAQFAGTYQGFHMRRPPSSELKRRFYYPES